MEYDINEVVDSLSLGDTPYRPFFVYGTLRPGYRNFSLCRGRLAKIEAAILPNHDIYGLGIPFCHKGTGSVKGYLLTPKEDQYINVLIAFDSLEGYHPKDSHSLYLRRGVSVITESGKEVDAWVYYDSLNSFRHLKKIPDGDYSNIVPFNIDVFNQDISLNDDCVDIKLNNEDRIFS